MRKLQTAYLLTGSNLGDRYGTLTAAKDHIHREIGEVLASSHFYETAPWGKEDQPDFLNQALKVLTSLSPLDLLLAISKIELTLGRKRNEKWDARTIDIDILMFEDLIFESPQLSIPHKHLHERNFTLVPLMEIAGEIEHPILKITIEELYWASNDPLDVYQLDLL